MKDLEPPEQRRKTRPKRTPPPIIKAEVGMDKSKSTTNRSRKHAHDPAEDLAKMLSRRVVGQPDATRIVIPYIQMFQAGLAPEGRPIGVFLLLGPTGTGKTKTVEALAEVLHGSAKNILRVDCGEFQMEHEVAKLIGAPPGYLGHRETQPMLTQQKLNSVASDKSELSLVLFDEIEKAAPSMSRLLLGVLDKGVLRLGDNSSVNFEKTMVFLTSNLGARDMLREINPDFGFQPSRAADPAEITAKLQNIGMGAVRKRFSPEFVNRIDAVITYQPLSAASLSEILDLRIKDLQDHVNTRLGARSFTLEIQSEARALLLARGTSAEYGARELNRTIHRLLTQPLATLVATEQVRPGSTVKVTPDEAGEKLAIKVQVDDAAPAHEPPTVLLVDDNRDLLRFLERLMADAGWRLLTAESAVDAKRLCKEHKPEAALLDYMLPDGNGAELAVEFKQTGRNIMVILMTGAILPPEEESWCDDNGIPVLRKPFLASDVMSRIRARLDASSPV